MPLTADRGFFVMLSVSFVTVALIESRTCLTVSPAVLGLRCFGPLAALSVSSARSRSARSAFSVSTAGVFAVSEVSGSSNTGPGIGLCYGLGTNGAHTVHCVPRTKGLKSVLSPFARLVRLPLTSPYEHWFGQQTVGGRDLPSRLGLAPVRVVAIHLAPGRRIPTRSVDSVEAEAGKGLVGDRYHGTKHRHVTVQSREALDAAAAQLGAPVESGATRRNITVDAGEIPTKPGTRIRIAEVELEVVRLSAPCRLLDDWIAPGAAAAMSRRGGSVCRVLTSGTVRVGADVILPPPE